MLVLLYMKAKYMGDQELKAKQILIKFGYSERIANKVEAWYKVPPN